MRALSLSQNAPSATWAQVLDNVAQILRKTEAAAALHDEKIRSWNADKNRTIDWQESLQQLQQQSQGRPLVLQQAEEEVLEADAELSAAQEALQRWLNEAAALQRTLANRVDPEV